MHIRAFLLAIAGLILFLTPSFAACSVVLGPRDIDRPVASTTNANRTGPVINGADYTDWETVAFTTPLSVTSGGFTLVPVGYIDGNGKTYNLTSQDFAACDSASITDESIDPLNIGAGLALAAIMGVGFLGRDYQPVFSIPGEGDGGGDSDPVPAEESAPTPVEDPEPDGTGVDDASDGEATESTD